MGGLPKKELLEALNMLEVSESEVRTVIDLLSAEGIACEGMIEKE